MKGECQGEVESKSENMEENEGKVDLRAIPK